MDYEQKYNEALKIAEKKKENSRNAELLSFIDDIFPELKDSKNEKIRKELIKWVKDFPDTTWRFISRDDVIAWLEKQGKRKSDPFNGVSFEYNNHTWGMCARDGGVDILCDSDLIKHIDNLQDEMATVSVIDENVDEVEHKFHEGDWVVKNSGKNFQGNRKFAQITEIEWDGRHWLDNGKYIEVEDIRLWTLEDAVNGDIIFAKNKIDDSLYFIRIFFKLEDKESWAHCNISSSDLIHWDFCVGTGYIESNKYDFYPATKEQCDLLFQKMKEEGYEWNSRKKELEKLPDPYCRENCKGFQETGRCFADGGCQAKRDAESANEYKGLTDFERVLTDICRSWIGFELGWQEYIKSNARILKNTLVKQLHAYDNPSEQESNKMKGKTALEALEEETVDNINKVEPKFKVGDWIITPENKVLQITSIKDTSYKFNNESHYWEVYYCDKRCRLWSIADAKDGDVLVDCNKVESILMFRGIGNTEWDDVIDYHCYYSCFRKAFYVQKGVEYWGNTNDHKLKPATKEQRDLLFQKMKDAGYEWDAEKKELIKIEQV